MRMRFSVWMIVLCVLLAPLTSASAQSVFSQKKVESIVIPLQDVAAGHRDAVRQVVEKPSIAARCQPETFPADIDAYRFFLDNPDRAVVAVRRLDQACVSIQNRGNGVFGYSDPSGNDVVWQTVLNKPNLRVWFAEGKVKPGPVLPLVGVKAVVVLHIQEVAFADGTTGIQHHTEFAVHTDSKTAQLVTKMLGPSSQRIAETGLLEFQRFFGRLGKYLSENPKHVAALTSP